MILRHLLCQYIDSNSGNALHGGMLMLAATRLWLVTAICYGLFWVWYVGLRGKLSDAEVEQYMQRFEAIGLSAEKQSNLRYFLENDDGREWFMVNLLELKRPKSESAALLSSYTKIFMGSMFKRAGHAFFVAQAKAKNIENVQCDQADNWTTAALVRYRSRRDCAEIFLQTFGSEHHDDKLAALEKTLAFPATTTMLLGSPRVLVALGLALISALIQIVFL